MNEEHIKTYAHYEKAASLFQAIPGSEGELTLKAGDKRLCIRTYFLQYGTIEFSMGEFRYRPLPENTTSSVSTTHGYKSRMKQSTIGLIDELPAPIPVDCLEELRAYVLEKGYIPKFKNSIDGGRELVEAKITAGVSADLYLQPYTTIYNSDDPLFDTIRETFPTAEQQKKAELNSFISLALRQLMRNITHVDIREKYFLIKYLIDGDKLILSVVNRQRRTEYIVYDPAAKPNDRLVVYRKSADNMKIMRNRTFVEQRRYTDVFKQLHNHVLAQRFLQHFNEAYGYDDLNIMENMIEWYQKRSVQIKSERAEKKQNEKQTLEEIHQAAIESLDLTKPKHGLYPVNIEGPTWMNDDGTYHQPIPRLLLTAQYYSQVKTIEHQPLYIGQVPVSKRSILFFAADADGKPIPDYPHYTVYTYSPRKKNLSAMEYRPSGKQQVHEQAVSTQRLPFWSIAQTDETIANDRFFAHGIEWLVNDPPKQASIQRLMDECWGLYVKTPWSKDKANRIYHTRPMVQLIRLAQRFSLSDDLVAHMESYARQIPYQTRVSLPGDNKVYRHNHKTMEQQCFELLCSVVENTAHNTNGTVTVTAVEKQLTRALSRPGINPAYTLKNSLLKTMQLTKQIYPLFKQPNTQTLHFPHDFDIDLYKATGELIEDSIHDLTIWAYLSTRPNLIRHLGNAYDTDSALYRSGLTTVQAWDGFMKILRLQLKHQGGIHIERVLRHAQYVRDVENICDIEGSNQDTRISMTLRKPFQFWFDYIQMAHTLQWDLSQRQLFYPRHLMSAHTRTQTLLKIKNIELDAIAFKKVAQKYKVYNKEYDNYLIRVAESNNELLTESTALSHCVSSYGKSMINERSIIFFLRDKEAPNQPLITLDVMPRQDGTFKLNQREGLKHRSPNTKEDAIIKQWFKDCMSPQITKRKQYT